MFTRSAGALSLFVILTGASAVLASEPRRNALTDESIVRGLAFSGLKAFYLLAIIVLVFIAPVRPSPGASESGQNQTPAPAAETKRPPIIAIAIASAIDDKGKLVNPRFTFPPNEPQITAIVYVGKSNGRQLKVTWYKVSEDEDGKSFDEKIFEHQIQVKSDERAFSVAKNPGGTLELGRYKVVATLEGQTKETRFDISPPKRPSKTSTRPDEELFEGQLQSKDADRAFSLGTNADGLRAASAFEWASSSVTRMQKVTFNASLLRTLSNAFPSQGAQQGNRPVSGTSGTAPPTPNPSTSPGCIAEIYNTGEQSSADSVIVFFQVACTEGFSGDADLFVGIAGASQNHFGNYLVNPNDWLRVHEDVKPCQLPGPSDLPGTKVVAKGTLFSMGPKEDYQSGHKTSYEGIYTLGNDTSKPTVHVVSTPERGSLVKAGDKITLDVNAREEKQGQSVQTGVRRIWLEAKPEGLNKPDEWINPSRLPKPCDQKTWEKDFQATYTVPKNPPPIIEICSYADDYADNEGFNCAYFATGEWRGTLREVAQGNLYNETVTVLFSFNEEPDGTIKGAGRVKVESKQQSWNDCEVTRKLITPQPLLFPISGRRVGDEFHLELPTDYRLRLRVNTDCPPPKTSGTGTATRSLGMSETFYHPRVKAQDGATNSFQRPGAMAVDGTIEIYRVKP